MTGSDSSNIIHIIVDCAVITDWLLGKHIPDSNTGTCRYSQAYVRRNYAGSHADYAAARRSMDSAA